jgi:hypothetical protein
MAQKIGGLASQDYGDFMSQLLSLYGQGLGGTRELGNIGYGATQGFGSVKLREAQNAVAKQQEKINKRAAIASTIAKIAASVAFGPGGFLAASAATAGAEKAGGAGASVNSGEKWKNLLRNAFSAYNSYDGGQ